MSEAVPSSEVQGATRHKPRLVKPDEIHAKVHGSGIAGRINAAIAVRLTKMVGSMWCAYLFAALALVALPQAMAGGALSLVQWISQTFLQLVLLSVIMVGENVLQAGADVRAEADHETIAALKVINDLQLQLLQKADAEIALLLKA